MRFRYARHVKDIDKTAGFYSTYFGLEVLFTFRNHDQYDGIILGNPDQTLQIEFTQSHENPVSESDEDDLLVFYFHTKLEWEKRVEKMKNDGVKVLIPKNSYWLQNGVMFADPDGHRVELAMYDIKISTEGKLNSLLHARGIETWNEVVDYIRKLSYGRNQNRFDVSLVIKEEKGTCSSKHALLRSVAIENNIPGVRLILGMYKMNHHNTPGIGNILSEAGLDFIPEAHCYLSVNHLRIDVTSTLSDFKRLEDDILLEMEITPEQVNEYKVSFHQNFIINWIQEEHIPLSFDTIWELREKCIQRLSE